MVMTDVRSICQEFLPLPWEQHVVLFTLQLSDNVNLQERIVLTEHIIALTGERLGINTEVEFKLVNLLWTSLKLRCILKVMLLCMWQYVDMLRYAENARHQIKLVNKFYLFQRSSVSLSTTPSSPGWLRVCSKTNGRSQRWKLSALQI